MIAAPTDRSTVEQRTVEQRTAEQGPDASVSVVIPYYRDQAGLDAVLAGLSRQSHAGPLQIIVADDGSERAPRLPRHVRLVRQEDLGFRAAAARNLGAAQATGEVLAFLDGDTVPEPGYIAAVVAALSEHPGALVIGTRTHLDTAADPPADRGEPAWLRAAWEATDHLRAADDTGFRYVISAVLSCRREVFEAIGGFDGSMVGYGGEDWELGWQALLAGCDLLHVPQAHAVHRGPDWGERSETDRAAALAQKNAETVRLALRITHPIMRAPGVVSAVPDLEVHWSPGHPSAGVLVPVLTDLLGSGDVHVHLHPGGAGRDGARQDSAERDGADREALGLEVFAADPRVRWEAPRAAPEGPVEGRRDARVRPRFTLELLLPVRVPPGQLQQACEEISRHGGMGEIVDPAGRVLLTVEPARARARAQTVVTRLVRDWTRLSRPVGLEDELRTEGESRSRPAAGPRA